MAWYDSVLKSASSGFGKYLESGEWVGDVMSGVGSGIAAHEASKDAKELAAQRRDQYYAAAPQGSIALKKGLLTGSGSLAGGNK